MSRFIRTAGHALAILFLSLSAFTAALAQAPGEKYGFCQGLAGNPRVNNFTRLFQLGPTNTTGALSGFLQYVHKKYDGMITQEMGCRTFATAAEAEAAYRKELADSAPHAATWPIVEIDWIPQGGSAIAGTGLAPASAPPAAAPKPQAPASAPAAAPAAGAEVRLDRWGKPIPTSAYWICESRVNRNLYSSAPFVAGTLNGSPQKMYEQFLAYLHKRYNQAGNATCNKFATQAEAEQHTARQNADAAGIGYQTARLDWTYPQGAPAVAAAPPVAAKPVAPAKPAAAAGKPGVYVICRVEWNRDLRRFYNPPVEGRDGGYSEWQAAYQTYLEQNHQFKGSGLGCGKYPNLAAAQADYDAWLANARATPTINGQPSPVIVTKWVY